MPFAPCARRRPPLALVLATSWSVAAVFQGMAARPFDPAESAPLPEPIGGIDRLLIAGTPNDAAAAAAAAAAPAEQALTEPMTRSESVVINLINRLVQRGVLTSDDSRELISMAEKDAAEARQAQAQAQEQTVQIAVSQAVTAAQEVAPAPEAAAADAVRITYIPETVKAEMREQIKKDVLDHARDGKFVNDPNSMPEWTQRFRVFGDIRMRGEGIYMGDGNDNTGAFPNFNAINTGLPFDTSGTVFSPQINVDQDRQRIRLRVRVGAAIDLTEGFTAGLRIATGDSNSPVSVNQSLGLANQGQGGNFSKYALWLDRAFFRYEAGKDPNHHFAALAGRFDNPFFSTEIMWDEDVGFDGFAVTGRYEVAKNITPFATAGAFPLFNTDLNFATNRPDKFESSDKYLYAGQIGVDAKPAKGVTFRGAVAYYYFKDVEGRLSDPYTPLGPEDAGNTDDTRPSFAQKGNTYRPLRNIVANANNDFGRINQFQYFGLATPFENVAVTGKLIYDGFEPVRVTLFGEWIKNLAFDGNAVDAIAVNNRGSSRGIGQVGKFEGGDTAWIAGLNVGVPEFQKAGDWGLGVNYRHVETDAVIDGFTNSNFNFGGTNVKGFTVTGAVALSKNVSLALRYMSSDQIAGPPLKTDIIFIDLNARF